MSHKRVTIGGEEYDAYPQRVGYLNNKLGRYFNDLVNVEFDQSKALALLHEKGYELLHVFYPKMMPEWQFHGYRTASAYEAGEFDEEYGVDHGADFPEVVEAFKVAMEVNGLNLFGDVVKRLGGFLDLSLIKAAANKWVAEYLADLGAAGSLTESSETTEESPSTTSTTTDPTPPSTEVELASVSA